MVFGKQSRLRVDFGRETFCEENMNLGRESEKQEFKSGLGQLDRGLKSLSAMLNRRNEGTVYFGVDDDGNIRGLDVGKQTLLDIRHRAQELIDPRIQLKIEELCDEQGRTYIKVHAVGSEVPYACNGRYFMCTAASDEQIEPHLLRRIFVSGIDSLKVIRSGNQFLTF